MPHNRKIAILISIPIILILAVWFTLSWINLAYRPLLQPQQQSLTIKLHTGAGAHTLAHTLQTAGVISQPRFFTLWIVVNGDALRLKAGEYQITPGMTAADLLASIVAGSTLQRSITFVEGWTFRQIKQALADNPHLIHTITHLNNAQIMAKLGYKRYPEGLFFPDTYFFIWGDSDIDILRTAYVRMQTVLATEWKQRAVGLPYKNPYQALIVASLVEKETALPRERALIAGVILRRWHQRIRLRVDPTVVYGLGRPYGSTLTQGDLDLDTPYNTYQRYGLPPTPIAMPGHAALVAALHPDRSNALYYVARGDGSHQFSATYRQHRRAIEKYLRRKPALHDRCSYPKCLISSFKEKNLGACPLSGDRPPSQGRWGFPRVGRQ